MIKRMVLIVAATLSLNGLACPKAAAQDNWVKEHHGIIFYQDYPADRYDLIELSKMARELGTDKVKTWLKGYKRGDIPNIAANNKYAAVFNSFSVICLNVCPDYILSRWDETRLYDTQTRNDVRLDFYNLVKFLIDNYSGQNKTFIINYFFEINVYIGTKESGRPDFPVLEFITDAQDGVKKALEADPAGIRILDCVESNCSHDYFHFVKNIFPKVNTDLYSISFYGDGSLDMIKLWTKYAPDNELFQDKNVMVGEYGIHMEDNRVNGDEEAQARYLESVRAKAKSLEVPYIFLFWLADQESKVMAEGHFGIVDLEGKKRKAWTDLNNAYQDN